MHKDEEKCQICKVLSSKNKKKPAKNPRESDFVEEEKFDTKYETMSP